jgi:hypothetical protein
LIFASSFRVVHPCFITCDNSLHKKPLLLHSIAAKKCMHISMHVCSCSSVSCFGIHLAQILLYSGLPWMAEYTDVQLMSNFSAVSLTVIHLFSWTRALAHSMRALTHSTLPTVQEVVRWPEWALSMMLFFHFWTFSSYCANILLWISEGFIPSDDKAE